MYPLTRKVADMKRRTCFAVLIPACATIILAAVALAQEATPAPPQPDQVQAVMNAWLEYMTPGEPHAYLAQRAGTWDLTVRFWEYPGGPAAESQCTSQIEVIMGGRYLLEKVEGLVMGAPFSGLAITGYDNLTQKFVGVWIDDMSTGIMRYEGTADATGKLINFRGEEPDFLAGTYKTTRGTDHMVDENTMVGASYGTTPEGKEFKNMEMRYSRRK